VTPHFPRSRRFTPYTPPFKAKPSRLTLGSAAATVAVAAGIAVAVSTSPGPAPAAFSGLAAVSAAGSTQTGHTTRLAVRGLQSAGPAAASASKLPVIAAAPQPATWPTGTPGASGRAPAAGTARASRSAAHVASPAGPARAATSAKPAAKPAAGRAAGRATPGTARVAIHSATRSGRAAPALRGSHHARPGRWYSIYDSVTPGAIPAHHAVATYATGNYAVSRHQVAGRRTVLWIDTTGYDYAASILDVEPGDATPTLAAQWAWHRLHRYPHSLARIYTMMSEWPAVKAAVAGFPAPLRARIRWWIADPTGRPHIVPGADATQWYWGNRYDITLAKPRF
jgi:hypothetical protein